MTDTPTPSSPKTTLKPTSLLVIAIVAILILAAFYTRTVAQRKFGDNIVEQAIEKQTGAKVDIDTQDETIKIKSEEGEMEIGATAQWPDDMPSDVPKFSAGSITAAVTNNDQSQKTWTVMIQNVDKESVDRYKAELENIGWQTGDQVSYVVSFVTFTKGNYKLNLAYDTTSRGVSLSLETVSSN